MKKLLALVLAFVMVFSFAACGGTNKDKGGNDVVADDGTAASALDNALKAIKNYSADGMQKYLLNGKIDESALAAIGGEEAAKPIFATMTWETVYCTEEGDMAGASVNITTDVAAQNAEIMLQKVDGQWKVTNPEAVVIVILSNMEGSFGDEK